VGGGEADDSVCEFLISMGSEFWKKPFGVFGFFGVVMCPVPPLMGNVSAQPKHRNTNRLRPKFRIHIEEEFTG